MPPQNALSRQTLYLDLNIPQTSYLRLIPESILGLLSLTIFLIYFLLSQQFFAHFTPKLTHQIQSPLCPVGLFLFLDYLIYYLGASYLLHHGFHLSITCYERARRKMRMVRLAKAKELLRRLVEERRRVMREEAGSEEEFGRAWEGFVRMIDGSSGVTGAREGVEEMIRERPGEEGLRLIVWLSGG